MVWQQIYGQDHVVAQFRRNLRQRRLASTFLFVGPPGVGKRTFALKLAQALLCETRAEEDMDPCGRCPACAQVRAGSHPDLLLVAKPKNKSFIPLEMFIGERDHRMREGLCHDISLKPFRGGRKVAIIDDADYLNQEGANALLKTLEEPPPKSVLILIGTSAERQLPTIRSRSQIVRFRPLPTDVVAELLAARGMAADPREAQRLAPLCEGSLDRAVELADPALWEFRRSLLDALGDADLDGVGFAKALAAFVEEAGRDAPSRRARMRRVIGFAVEFYRQLVRRLCGAAAEGDDDLERALSAARRSWRGDEIAAVACIDRSLEALAQIDANANQATLLECWIDELAEILRTGRPLPAR